MNDAVFKNAAALIAKGVPVVAVWGVHPDGTCACHKGADCQSAGKHPVGVGWQNKAITDEDTLIEEIGEADGPRNIGIPLGPRSGIIDIEYDTEEGKATADALGLPGFGTASFKSSRSRHFLFKYDRNLPLKAAIPNAAGLEVRIGADGRGAQSVAPGSIHRTGVPYEWVPGASIDEVDVLPLPRSVLDFIVSNDNAGSSRAPNLALTKTPVTTGGRHDAVRKQAFQMAAMCNGEETPNNRQMVYESVSALNQVKCQPPLEESEVKTLVDSAFGAYRRWKQDDVEPAEMVAKFVDGWQVVDAGGDVSAITRSEHENSLSNCGLVQLEDGTWDCGTWRLSVQAGSPKTFVLHIPFMEAVPGGRVRRQVTDVRLTSAEMGKADVVAAKILEATGTMDLSPFPGFWNGVWNGTGGGKKSQGKVGIKYKLVQSAATVAAEDGDVEWTAFARAFVRFLFTPDRDTMMFDAPSATGEPQWVDGIGLTFKWSEMVDQIVSQSKTATEEHGKLFRKAVKKHLGDGVIRSTQIWHGGRNRRYSVIDEKGLELLDEFVEGLS